MIRSEDAVVAVAVFSRRRHEVGESIEELPRREINDAVLSRDGGRALPAGADPLAALMSGQQVADAFGVAVTARVQREPLEGEGGPGTIPEKVFETPRVARDVPVHE
jgi:hypothetical protein